MGRFLTKVLVETACTLGLGAVAFTGATQTKTVPLYSLQGSGVHGTATFVQEGENLVVTIDVQGLPPNATPHAAHIHNGTCEHLGHNTPYDFNPVVHGHSRTTLKGVKMDDFVKGSYAIVIHRYLANISIHVACGGPI